MALRVLAGRAVFIILFAVVTFLTVAPSPDGPGAGMAVMRAVSALLFGDPDYGDKVAHFCAYAALGASALFAFGTARGALIAPVALALYGAGLEGVQSLLVTRSAEGLDAVANALGAFTGYFGAAGLRALVAGRRSA